MTRLDLREGALLDCGCQADYSSGITLVPCTAHRERRATPESLPVDPADGFKVERFKAERTQALNSWWARLSFGDKVRIWRNESRGVCPTCEAVMECLPGDDAYGCLVCGTFHAPEGDDNRCGECGGTLHVTTSAGRLVAECPCCGNSVEV